MSGAATYRGENLLTMNEAELNKIRGNRIGMIFQDPMTSLNPFLTIERQMTETLQLHRKISRREARRRAIETLETVRFPMPRGASTCIRTSSPAACGNA